jgi:hypothetical protein
MNNEIFFLLLRNTLLSWIINIEFVAPLLFWLVAHKSRDHYPILERKIKTPVMLLMGAGLVKQIYMQFFFPLMLFNENLQASDIGYWIYLVAYTLLLVAGFLLLIKLNYAHRLVDENNPWGKPEGNFISPEE